MRTLLALAALFGLACTGPPLALLLDAKTGVCIPELEIAVAGGRTDTDGTFGAPGFPTGRHREADPRQPIDRRAGSIGGELRLIFDTTRARCRPQP